MNDTLTQITEINSKKRVYLWRHYWCMVLPTRHGNVYSISLIVNQTFFGWINLKNRHLNFFRNFFLPTNKFGPEFHRKMVCYHLQTGSLIPKKFRMKISRNDMLYFYQWRKQSPISRLWLKKALLIPVHSAYGDGERVFFFWNIYISFDVVWCDKAFVSLCMNW